VPSAVPFHRSDTRIGAECIAAESDRGGGRLTHGPHAAGAEMETPRLSVDDVVPCEHYNDAVEELIYGFMQENNIKPDQMTPGSGAFDTESDCGV
jgi:hypothetical protein